MVGMPVLFPSRWCRCCSIQTHLPHLLCQSPGILLSVILLPLHTCLLRLLWLDWKVAVGHTRRRGLTVPTALLITPGRLRYLRPEL